MTGVLALATAISTAMAAWTGYELLYVFAYGFALSTSAAIVYRIVQSRVRRRTAGRHAKW